jgi:hypothetical protein
MRWELLLVGLVLTAACGPTKPNIHMTRVVYTAARPDNCNIDVVNVPATELGPTSEWERVGDLTVTTDSRTDNADPYGAERLAALRPKACSLGGEALTLWSEMPGLTGYSVLVKKPAK